MKLSDLIEHLKSLQVEHGDLRLETWTTCEAVGPDHFELCPSYHGEDTRVVAIRGT